MLFNYYYSCDYTEKSIDWVADPLFHGVCDKTIIKA